MNIFFILTILITSPLCAGNAPESSPQKDVATILRERCEALAKEKASQSDDSDAQNDKKIQERPEVDCSAFQADITKQPADKEGFEDNKVKSESSVPDNGKAPYVITPDHVEHDMAALLKERCDALDTEKVEDDFLKTKKYDDVFYVPIKLLHPNITRFPYLSLQLQLTYLARDKPRLGKKLKFNDGKAFRDKHNAKYAIIGPGHNYLVYTGNPIDLLHDVLAGAKTMPVKIIKDLSSIHNDAEFWKILQKNEDAYIQDLDGKEQKPPVRIDDIKDENYLNNWLILFPEIFHFPKPPHQRIFGFVEYPAGIRVQADCPKFGFYELARQLYAEDSGNFRDPIFMRKAPPSYDLDFQKYLQQRMYKAFDEGDMYRLDWVHIFDEETKFQDIKLFQLTGTSGQILVMSKMPDRDLPEVEDEDEESDEDADSKNDDSNDEDGAAEDNNDEDNSDSDSSDENSDDDNDQDSEDSDDSDSNTDEDSESDQNNDASDENTED